MVRLNSTVGNTKIEELKEVVNLKDFNVGEAEGSPVVEHSGSHMNRACSRRGAL